MKLNARDAKAFLSRPPAGHPGALIYGPDAVRTSDAKKALITALVGPGAEDEMRLTRLSGADVRKDPAMVLDALKAQGFFPGPRAVVVEEATDTIVKALTSALTDWAEGDATLIATAGQLTPRSALRKLFEGHPKAAAIAIYDNPPDRSDIEEMLGAAGVPAPDRDAMEAILALSRAMEPADLRQTIQKLGLYMLNQSGPTTIADVEACAPQTTEADLDDALNAVADGRSADLGPILRRLYAQGMQPVGLCIGTMRHFRSLHAAASDPGGAAQGVGKLRPPVFGPRRDKIVRQASSWGRPRLERALTVLTDTDLALRSAGQTAPQAALMERALIRLAMMVR